MSGTARIGIVGAGSIVRGAHLPSYRARDLNVVGVFDVDAAAASAVSGEFGLTNYGSVEDLLGDVDVVDIAVPPRAQYPIALQAIAAKVHVLAQKPLATSVDTAEAIVRAAESHGTAVVVNQQLRYSSAIRTCSALVHGGELGAVSSVSITALGRGGFRQWPWIERLDRQEAIFHSIHYLDACRYLFGEASTVYAVQLRHGGRGETHTRALVSMGAVSVLLDSDTDRRTNSSGTVMTIEGSRGGVRFTPGSGTDGGHDRLEVSLDGEPWTAVPLTGDWFIDSFAEPMLDLLEQVRDPRHRASSSATDNLATLRLVDAVYRSAELGVLVEV